MEPTAFLERWSWAQDPDQSFTEAISQKMQVPEHLQVVVGPAVEQPEKLKDVIPVCGMNVPDRLSLAENSDSNPRPFFHKSFKHSGTCHFGSAWARTVLSQDPPEHPLRRSYSDQNFRTSHVTPTPSERLLHAPSCHGTGDPQQSAEPPAFLSRLPTLLRATKDLGCVTFRQLWQMVTQNHFSRFSCPENSPAALTETPGHADPGPRRRSAADVCPVEDDWSSVDLIVLRRQVAKMNRRLVALERQNVECRQNEQVVFALLLSAFLLNGWLWLRR